MTEEQKFIVLINQYPKILHKVTRLYTYTKEDRNDLLQEILFQAWRSFAKFKGEALFSTWLYRVALNTALTFGKKTHYQKRSLPLETLDVAHPENGLENNKEMLYRAIRQLPEVDRLLISLHLDGYANEEIADIAGITSNNVSVKLYRIKQKLTNLLTLQPHGSV